MSVSVIEIGNVIISIESIISIVFCRKISTLIVRTNEIDDDEREVILRYHVTEEEWDYRSYH